MALDYLLFDFSDEESGAGSFDAMASVGPDRLPALAAEVARVLGWAHRAFGAPSAAAGEGAGEWDYALHATSDAGAPLDVGYDAVRSTVSLVPPGEGRTTLTLTLGGSRAFCEALREAFGDADD